MAHSHPQGRCQLPMPCPVGALGGGPKGPSSPTRSVSGKAPSIKGQMLPEVLLAAHPRISTRRGKELLLLFCCFYQTKRLLLPQIC